MFCEELSKEYINGVSLLTANQSVNWHFPVEDNVKRVIARPFSGSHEHMAAYLGIGFKLDCNAALEWLKRERASREKDVLAYQIKQFERWQQKIADRKL